MRNIFFVALFPDNTTIDPSQLEQTKGDDDKLTSVIANSTMASVKKSARGNKSKIEPINEKAVQDNESMYATKKKTGFSVKFEGVN